VRVLSLGAGVQSTALLMLVLEGRVQADCAIFADTQAEPQEVYRHLWEVCAKRAETAGFPLYIVSAGDLAEDAAGRITTRIPAFVGEGMMPRQCTRDYKLVPIRQQIRKLTGGKPAVQLMGISLDEVERMKTSPVKWLSMEYPLIFDMQWTRWDCQRYLQGMGIDAPKSACVFCPYHSDSMWRSLDPVDFEVAAQFEERLQRTALLPDLTRAEALRGVPYLHRSRMLLREVDFTTPEDHGQVNWLNECEGVCGV
jgi:hypothetical protein